MQKVGWWLLAALLVVAAIAGFVWLSARGDKKGATDALADTIEAWHEPRIKAAKQRADALSTQFGKESMQAKAAQMDVDASLAELKGKFTKLDLTPEQVEQRLKGYSV